MHSYDRWREALRYAPSAAAVNGIVRDYVEALRPILGILPAECSAVLGGNVDIQHAAVTLLHAEMRFAGSHEERALLHEIAHTLASAAVRITMLHVGPTERASVSGSSVGGAQSAIAGYGEA